MKLQNFILGIVLGCVIVILISKLNTSGYATYGYGNATIPDISGVNDYNTMKSMTENALAQFQNTMRASFASTNTQAAIEASVLQTLTNSCTVQKNAAEWSIRNANLVPPTP